MSDQGVDASVEVEAARIAKQLRRREEIAWAIGFIFYLALEFFRLKYWAEDSSKWSLFGGLIPFETLVFLVAFLSATSMQTTLRERGYSNERSQFEKSITLVLQRQDAEGLRLIRGKAVASSICAFVLGMVMSGVARTYFFN